MKVADIVNAMEAIAPTQTAESWDNVGLITGDPEQSATKVMLTIDYTAEVAIEAGRMGCDVVIAYHPPLFEAVKRVTAGSLVFDAIRRGISLYSPHTALDLANGGTNDMLADAAGLVERSPLKVTPLKMVQHKLVVFVPAEALDRVSAALFEAGAGRIGNYTSCSFRSTGHGTFFGEAGTQPTAGQSGRLETTEEIRVETVLPANRVEPVLKALRSAHPYEKPAFDLIQLAAPPTGVGMGRIGTLAAPTPATHLFERIKRELGISHLLIAGQADRMVQRIAVCAGACGSLLDEAICRKADVYLTGEMRHHDAVKAARAGLTVVCTLHSNSERAVLKRLKDQLMQRLPDLPVLISEVDCDPFRVI